MRVFPTHCGDPSCEGFLYRPMFFLIAAIAIEGFLYLAVSLLLGGTAVLLLAAIDVGLLAVVHHHHFTARP